MSDLEQVELIQSVLAARGAGSIPEEDMVSVAFVNILDPMIRLVITKYPGCRNDVQDLVQDVWIALIQRLPKLHFDPAAGTLRAWVAGVARRLASRHARRLSRHHHEALTAQLAAVLLDSEAGPETESEWKQQREQEQAILADLRARIPELSYRIIVMHCIEDRSVPVIAAELGVSEDCVKMRLRRARRKLQDLLRRRGLGPS